MTNAKRAGTGDADPLLKVDSGDLLSASSDEIATQADARTAPISIDRCVRLDDICIAPDRTSPLVSVDVEKLVASMRDIGLVGITSRLRVLRPEAVAVLAASMKALGLLQPIVVRPGGGAGYYLVAGRHRYEAARSLGWETISARVLAASDADDALLAEIDENLMRLDLSPAERSAHQVARKAVYERLHPETKATSAGGPGRAKTRRQVGDESTPADRYTKETAEKTGRSERNVQREAKRGKEIPNVIALVGTSLDKGEELDALAKLPEGKRDELIARAIAGEKVSAKVEVKKDRRETREKVLAGVILALPTEKCGVIVSDDEFDHQVWSRETGMDRHAANHYETASDAHTAEELHTRTKGRFECAADNCLLAMWATVQHLDVAIDLLRLRGFRYVSHYVWGKDKIGMGYWNRNKHEILLIGVKGDIPCPAPGTQWDSLIMAPRREHSAKPECFLEMIEQYFPNIPKIELNRRGPARPGWIAWGNQSEPARADSTATPMESTGDSRGSTDSTCDDHAFDIPAFLLRGSPACPVRK
jgi:N6-adenosine-specific RNA methylase IME4/uncharacterized ParB-like nuclease family protein